MINGASANKTAYAPDTDDWLGYGAYADALWSRVVRALDKDNKTGKPLGDDPLVIGIFGEWGAGKSHLLKLVYRRAEDQSARDIAARVMTAADDLTIPLTVTVPVMFQPWKYEHEPHLHVPLAIHVADALEDAWKKLPTDFEHVKVFVQCATEGLADAGEKIEAAKGLMVKIGKVWGATKQVVHSNVTKVVAGTVDVAAMSFGVPPLLTGLLSKARDQVAEPEEVSDESDEKGKPKDADKAPKTVKKTAAEKRTTAFSHSQDGLAFYRIHKLMQAMTRPKFDAKSLKAAGLKIGESIEFDLRINFVVFVDDLDRCLPEKAVETLELIKTTFNIESFAFVLALDDEVIERGIGHRYKDYFLQGKKPDMPITGFEYLEKIVHVPFRLPALTKVQAREFLIRYEASVEDVATSRWFAPVSSQPMTDSTYQSPDNRYATTGIKLDLVDLALSAFDAYVPRKLIRLVELMHQIANIAQMRSAPLQRRHAGKMPLDTRVVLALLMIQLFQPELSRTMRRRPESFPALLRAFAKPADTSQGTEPELTDAKVSNLDLWRWAIKPNVTLPSNGIAANSVTLLWKPSPQEAFHSYAVQRIVEEHPSNSAERTTAQHVRLPMVEQIVEHRAAQRHVFDVLKLVQTLATDMEDTNSEPHQLVFEPYRSLLAMATASPVPSIVSSQPKLDEGTTQTSSATSLVQDTRPTFNLRNVKELVGDLISEDTSAQANMASRHEFRQGHILDDKSASELSDSLLALAGGTTTQLKILNGLQFLAPFVSAYAGKRLWETVQKCVDPANEINLKLLVLWADVRSMLGCDPRFDLPDRAYAMAERFPGHGVADEPIPGFVHIPAGKFTMGSDADDDNKPHVATIAAPFYMQRTLVTVDQYALFLEGGGSIGPDWWDKQGLAWSNGKFDSKVQDKNVREWLAKRPVDLRKEPMDWQSQKRVGSRPVVGITWFEARAYARWLNQRMHAHIIESGLAPEYQVMLPTEVQWERAARADSITTADSRRWPWGDDEKQAEQRANLSQKIGSPCAVGLYPPNPIGLYDMVGNAWEWMDNLYQSKPAKMDGVKKDVDLISGETVDKSDTPTLRGGSWFNVPDNARCSCRDRAPPGDWGDDIGLRVVLSLAT